jgi:hypothetical protein
MAFEHKGNYVQDEWPAGELTFRFTLHFIWGFATTRMDKDIYIWQGKESE